ncbi:cupin domain-containing protein [Labrys okinawensis]|uniref:cupin domain-containing protein n=1 Tax=Labrys okinawensis TaxID=346911 RepID=UPI0039BD667A
MDEKTDAFAGLAPLLRVRPQLQQLSSFGAQWASWHDHEEQGWAPFHIVSHGGCLLDVGEQHGILLEVGDVAILPHSGQHNVRSLQVGTDRPQPKAVVKPRRAYSGLTMRSVSTAKPFFS